MSKCAFFLHTDCGENLRKFWTELKIILRLFNFRQNKLEKLFLSDQESCNDSSSGSEHMFNKINEIHCRHKKGRI